MARRGQVQDGDVAEPDERFGVASHGVEVESVGDPVGTLASPRGEDRADARVTQRSVEVGEPVLVDPGEKGMLVEGVCADLRTQTPAT